MRNVILLIAGFQASLVAAQPRAEPFDCSWVYHPPTGSRERFEGVYFSFIDNNGFYPCSSDRACKDWMGKETEEVAFSDRAWGRFQKRGGDIYGVFRIVFEGRRGKLADRPGCEADPWNLGAEGKDYVRVEKVLDVKPLDDTAR